MGRTLEGRRSGGAGVGALNDVLLPRRTLTAILLNPPACTTGTRSRSAVRRAATVLGYDEVRIANLCAAATPTVVELNKLDPESWKLARPTLQEALECADAMLAGWGVAGVTGKARHLLLAQVDWLYAQATSAGIRSIWMVGGKPRHPSRWHQYVSDKYGRTNGGTPDQRLRQVLTEVALNL